MHHTLQSTKTAHIYTHNSLSDKTNNIWIVLHGYGQLAKYFIRKFNFLDERHFVIAPEALSRFYVQGYSGRVGANWMTKEDRLTDIEDYIRYLNNVYSHFLPNRLPDNCKINVLGFSQGGATASRWAAETTHRIDNLILFSCVFPEDLNFPEMQKKDINFYLLYGNNDEFNVDKQLVKIDPLLKQENLSCKIIQFEGKHNIPANVLQDFIETHL